MRLKILVITLNIKYPEIPPRGDRAGPYEKTGQV